MTSDAYLTCPGGTGKKLKFCCADLVNEIPKLNRMIEGDQRLACLDQIERLEKKYQDRACLLAMKLAILAGLERHDEAVATARQFADVHPQNPVALSQKALLTAQEGRLREGVEIFGRAMESCPQEMPPQVYYALGPLAELLLMDKQTLPTLAILRTQASMAPQDETARRGLSSLERARWVPLLIRDDTYPDLVPPEAEFSQRDRESYIAAMNDMLHLRYAKAIAGLEAIAARAPAAKSVWRTIGYVRGYAVDNEGAAAALRKFASSGVAEEDAIEAEGLAQLLAAEDQVDQLVIEYPVSDADQVAAALVASKQTIELPVDPRTAQEGEPPPRGIYVLTDRPPVDDANVTVELLPTVIARVALFGKQTDREARLEVDVTRWNLDAVRSLLSAWLPNSLGQAGEPEVTHSQPLTTELFHAELQMPQGLGPEKGRELQAEVLRQRVFDTWPSFKLACLGGKTPLEAAHDPSLRLPLAAAVLILELEAENVGGKIDFNELRQKLGLPPAGTIDPSGLDIEQLSLVRLRRVDVSPMSDEQLTAALGRAATFDIRTVVAAIAKQMIARPQLMEKLGADRIYMMLASAATDAAEALKYLGEGRTAALAAKHSTAFFDIQELEVHAAQRNIPEVQRVLNEILRQHWSQPGVQEAVSSILMSAGIVAAPRQAVPAAGAAPLGPPAPEGASQPSGIWTPDAERSGSGKSALWTPGMD